MNNLKLLFVSLIAVLAGNEASAQFSASEYLDINQIKANHMVHGDMWYHPSTSQPGCEYPKGTGKHASYAGAIWISGRDNLGNLYTSAQMYQSRGADYWPGPLDAVGNLSFSTSTNWAKIWKVNASTIVDFRHLYASGGVSAITGSKFDVIKEWPAKGNIHAKGNAGAALTISDNMAPFIDANGDGIYNWQDGDYPNIKGDQMLWWVFSDNGPTHLSSKGTPLRVEYHAMAYAYNRGTDVDRIIFYEFTMHNKSTLKYNEFRFGLFSDADLGNPFDDYIAFDSSHRMGIEYNAEMPDRPHGANSYGYHPPLTGLSFLEMPGDVYPAAMLPTGSFNYFNSSFSGPLRDPSIDTVFDHYLHAKNADGLPQAFGNYAYPITNGDEMCINKVAPADRRYVISSNDYAFQPGTKVKIAMAFMVTDTLGYACPLASFKPITDLADTAWKVYWNPLPPLNVSNSYLADKTFKIYPNPTETILYVQTSGNGAKDENIRIVDALGKTIELAIRQKQGQYEININSLASGIYSVVYFNGTDLSAQTFVKQ